MNFPKTWAFYLNTLSFGGGMENEAKRLKER